MIRQSYACQPFLQENKKKRQTALAGMKVGEANLYWAKIFKNDPNKDKREIAFENLVAINMPSIIKCAKSRPYFNVHLDDLVQSGMIGLKNALDTFDFSRCVQVWTWAHWQVRKEMQAFLRSICKYEKHIEGIHADNAKQVIERLAIDPNEENPINKFKPLLNKLPQHVRRAMEYQYGYGIPFKQIPNMGCSRQAVHLWVKRLREDADAIRRIRGEV